MSISPKKKSWETLGFKKKNRFSPSDQSLSDLLHSKTKTMKTKIFIFHHFVGNSKRITVSCFPYDVIVFALLPLVALGGKQLQC